MPTDGVWKESLFCVASPRVRPPSREEGLHSHLCVAPNVSYDGTVSQVLSSGNIGRVRW